MITLLFIETRPLGINLISCSTLQHWLAAKLESVSNVCQLLWPRNTLCDLLNLYRLNCIRVVCNYSAVIIGKLMDLSDFTRTWKWVPVQAARLSSLDPRCSWNGTFFRKPRPEKHNFRREQLIVTNSYSDPYHRNVNTQQDTPFAPGATHQSVCNTNMCPHFPTLISPYAEHLVLFVW